MAARKESKTKVKTKHYVFGVDKMQEPMLRIGVNLESVNTTTSQLSALVLSLVKFELIRRNAYERWRLYLNQVGLRLPDLIAYLNVLHDDDQLIRNLKAYYFRSISGVEKIELLRQANELKEQLVDKIKLAKVLNSFPIQKVK